MAKYRETRVKKVETGTIITTPSAYGSHKSMVVPEDQLNQFDVVLHDGEVLCKDDTHYYVTLKNRLDTGLADPKRNSKSVFKK